MLTKIVKKLTALAASFFKPTTKRKSRRRQSHRIPPTATPAISPLLPMLPFVFPAGESTVVPDPSQFFSPDLLSSPLPTNSFFQNFALRSGDQPEFIHPYLIQSNGAALSISYPSRVHSSRFVGQVFVPDLTFSVPYPGAPRRHRISAFDDLSVTLDLPPHLRFYLARGCPFVTIETLGSQPVDLIINSVHAFLSADLDEGGGTKCRLVLNNSQTFALYSSAPLRLEQSGTSRIAVRGLSGVLRVAFVPDADCEAALDNFSGCYPVAGEAELPRPFSVQYHWRRRGHGSLLMLAHPLHLKLLSNESRVEVLDSVRYRSIDGDLVGVVGDSWVLRTDPVAPTWYSTNGVAEDGCDEIASALQKDVDALASISTASSYFYGKAIARAARLALIAEEIGFTDVIPAVRKFLKSAITPWLDGSFAANGFLYDKTWGGLVTKQGMADSGADFGFGIYNDHHYHLGYFLYAIAVLAKIDPAWGRTYRPQAYAMAADFMTLSRKRDSSYTRLRMFDLWKLHSWAGGLTEFADGRNQESTSEAVNAYYAAALLGLSYGDTHLVASGSTIMAFEILASQMWWHVCEAGGLYEDDFSKENRFVGVLWSNKRDSGLWFAPPEWKECRLGIQVLPLLPVTESLFPDIRFVREAVNWAQPALARPDVGEGWKGFVYALEGMYDKDAALEKTRALTAFDDGNSLSNMLWWLHSRNNPNDCATEGGICSGVCCWYRQYCC